jgi:hypothetical protein
MLSGDIKTIPAGDTNYENEISYQLPATASLAAVGPHMHARGSKYVITARNPGKAAEKIFDLHRFRFDMPQEYVFLHPIELKAGARIRCLATFDNSTRNPFNPNPNVSVSFGYSFEDEMHSCYLALIIDPKDHGVFEGSNGPPRPAQRSKTESP